MRGQALQANPTLLGHQAENQAWNMLPKGHQQMILDHPLVASGQIRPEAAHKLMGMSIPRGKNYYEGLREVATGGAPAANPAAMAAGTAVASPRAMARAA